jgi:lysozyme
MPDGKILISRLLTAVALALAAVLPGCGGGVGPLDALNSDLQPADYPIHGIDVSKFQGDIDWNAVAGSGVKFAWIKATEGGDNADARFQANWTGAKAAGVPHGAYHFVYWCRPPMEEMANFEQNAPVEVDALPPVLDVEATPTSKTCHRHLTQEGAIAEMKVMLDEMERHYGKRPVIYTTVDFYQAILADGAFTDYPIWVRSTKYHPTVKYGPRAWHFWQYQSDGSVAGIAVHVDRDAFFGTNDQWQAFLRDGDSGARKGDGRAPSAPQPAAPEAIPPQPATPDAVAAQPAMPDAVAAQPVAAQPVETQPAQSGARQGDDPRPDEPQ